MREIIIIAVALPLVALTIYLVGRKVRHEPDYRIHRGPITFVLIFGFVGAFLLFGSVLAAILCASFLSAFALGLGVYYEGMLHAECGIHSPDRSLGVYTGGRKGAASVPQNDTTLKGGHGPSGR